MSPETTEAGLGYYLIAVRSIYFNLTAVRLVNTLYSVDLSTPHTTITMPL